jgi:hypothetical protein
MMFSKPVTYASLASTASAWIAMTNPIPFVPDSAEIINMPLHGDGSNFPCHGVTYDVDQLNVYEAGSTQELNFKGVSVYAGGSCQVSMTTDLQPTKDSVWKVIKSIEGGCPAQGAVGNLEYSSGDPYNTPVPFAYNFTVPDLAPGQYTLAWTWFNKVGNREMYMNCAPLEVTGGSGSIGLDTLPDMFVAHLSDVDCMVPEGGDLVFPNPGSEVEQLNGATTAWVEPMGSQCTGAPTMPGVNVPAITTEAPVATETLVAPPAGSAGTPCANQGFFNCVDGRSYQRCEAGVWTDLKQIGDSELVCKVGESAYLEMAFNM